MANKDRYLFRGKRYATDELIEGSLLVWPDGTTEICNTCPDNENELWKYLVREETVGQYTGLPDKAGRKAFEHDVIKHHFGDEIGVIRYGSYRNPFGDDSHGGHVGFYAGLYDRGRSCRGVRR